MKMACPRDTPWRITLSTTHLGLALPMLAWALWWWWFRPSLRLIWEAELPPEAPSYHLYTRKSPQLNMVMMMMIVVTMIANNLKQHSFISTVVQLNFELNERFSRKEKTKEKNYYFWVGGCPPQTIFLNFLLFIEPFPKMVLLMAMICEAWHDKKMISNFWSNIYVQISMCDMLPGPWGKFWMFKS